MWFSQNVINWFSQNVINCIESFLHQTKTTYALVIARFRVQYGQYFPSFSYFADLLLFCGNNSKIWETRKILAIFMVAHCCQLKFESLLRLYIEISNWNQEWNRFLISTTKILLIWILNCIMNLISDKIDDFQWTD